MLPTTRGKHAKLTFLPVETTLHIDQVRSCSLTASGTHMALEIGIGPAISLLATSPQGSVLQQCSGNSEQTFAYSAFGYDQRHNGLSPVLGYNAQPRDLTGNYLLGRGYRVYSPALMIFTSPDIYSPFDKGGLNSYAYCNRDPINLVDPDGEAGLPLGRILTDGLPELKSRSFRSRQILPVALIQAPALAIEPDHAPAQAVRMQPRQPSIAARGQQQAPSLRRVPNNLAALVAAPENVRPQQRRPGFISRIRSISRRVVQSISSALHRRNSDATGSALEATYSAQRMHASMRFYRQANARNTNFPVTNAAQDARTEN